MGGLLLWGVEAALDRTMGIDVVSDFRPIAELTRFESEARTLSSEALMPRIKNVDFATIEEPAVPGTGYLAMYIERSERRPRKFRGPKGYYRRSMSSTREREHFELEDAFKSLQIPELELDLKMFGGSTYSGPAKAYPAVPG